MITAVDTSVLLDVFTADSRFVDRAQAALRESSQQGTLVLCEIVVAELRPFFRSRQTLQAALDTLGAELVPVSADAAMSAGEAFQRYRRSGGPRRRLIPDFIIAAHAKDTADRLLTRDRGFYRKWFRSLTILEP